MQVSREGPAAGDGMLQQLVKTCIAPGNGVDRPFDPQAVTVQQYYPGALPLGA